MAGVKSMGSFLFSSVNTAAKKVTETTAKIKKTVGENVSTCSYFYTKTANFEFLLCLILTVAASLRIPYFCFDYLGNFKF